MMMVLDDDPLSYHYTHGCIENLDFVVSRRGLVGLFKTIRKRVIVFLFS